MNLDLSDAEAAGTPIFGTDRKRCSMKFPKMRTSTAILIASAVLTGFAPAIEARFASEFANPACSAQSPCSIRGKLPDAWVPDAPEGNAVSAPPNTVVAAATGSSSAFGSAGFAGAGSFSADATVVHP